MKINYSTKLDTGGEDNHVTITVDGDITNPGDVEFVLSMVRRLIDYDQQRVHRLRAAAHQHEAARELPTDGEVV